MIKKRLDDISKSLIGKRSIIEAAVFAEAAFAVAASLLLFSLLFSDNFGSVGLLAIGGYSLDKTSLRGFLFLSALVGTLLAFAPIYFLRSRFCKFLKRRAALIYLALVVCAACSCVLLLTGNASSLVAGFMLYGFLVSFLFVHAIDAIAFLKSMKLYNWTSFSYVAGSAFLVLLYPFRAGAFVVMIVVLVLFGCIGIAVSKDVMYSSNPATFSAKLDKLPGKRVSFGSLTFGFLLGASLGEQSLSIVNFEHGAMIFLAILILASILELAIASMRSNASVFKIPQWGFFVVEGLLYLFIPYLSGAYLDALYAGILLTYLLYSEGNLYIVVKVTQVGKGSVSQNIAFNRGMGFLGTLASFALVSALGALLDERVLVIGVSVVGVAFTMIMFCWMAREALDKWICSSSIDQRAVAGDELWKSCCLAVSKRFELSPRECEVFILLSSKLSASEIVSDLGVSHATVKTHIYHIYQKMDVHSQLEAVSLVEDEVRRASSV